MTPTKRAASAIAAIALMFAATACAKDDAATTDTAAGAISASTPSAEDADDRVEVALSTDSTLRPFGLDADEEDGRIELKGAVRTEEQRTAAAQVASRVAPGVTIDNRIRVDANARVSENTIDVDEVEEQVEKAIEDDATLKPFDLDTDEDNGQLVLEGTVKTAEQKTLAEQIAKRIAGTVTVTNKIKVQ